MVAIPARWPFVVLASVALVVAALWLSSQAGERQARADSYADALEQVKAMRDLAANWDALIGAMRSDAAAGLDALTAHLARAQALEGRLQNAARHLPDPPARVANDLSAYLNAVDAHEQRVRRLGMADAFARPPANQSFAGAAAEDVAVLGATLEDALQSVLLDYVTAAGRWRAGISAAMAALTLLWAAQAIGWQRSRPAPLPVGRITTPPERPGQHENGARDAGATQGESAEREEEEDAVEAAEQPPGKAVAQLRYRGVQHPKPPPVSSTSQFRTDQALLRHRMIAAMVAEELAALAEQVRTESATQTTAVAQRLTTIAHGLDSLPSEQNTRYDVLDIDDCLDEAVAAATRAAPVEVTRLNKAAPAVFASKTEVVMLLANVIENAAQASRQEGAGRIVVCTDEDRGRATVVVLDDGAGVPPAQRERLFQPFSGARDGRLGVGLAIAARLAERNGGTISIEAAAEGVAARITLPGAA